MKKYKCKCCGYYTLEDKPVDPDFSPGTFEICPVCGWEDDSLQYLNPNLSGGANTVSLNQAKENFKRYGAKCIECVDRVREPYEDEKEENQEEKWLLW